LFTEGHEEAAMQLEQLWEGLARRFSLELFGAYMGASDARSQNNPEYQHLRAIHSLCSQG